jgi:1,2-dihydroxy-3-keto-5-methylthiopentene dioxygenase
MATVTFYDRDAIAWRHTRHPADVPAALWTLGIPSGRWALREAPVSATPQLAYASQLLALQRRFASVMTDHVRVPPRPERGGGPARRGAAADDWAETPHEHTHDDVELRVVLRGQARVLVRAPAVGGWAELLCEAGDWLALPPGLPHVLQPSPAQGLEMLRLFSRPKGWHAEATGAALPAGLAGWPALAGSGSNSDSNSDSDSNSNSNNVRVSEGPIRVLETRHEFGVRVHGLGVVAGDGGSAGRGGHAAAPGAARRVHPPIPAAAGPV